MSIVSSIRRIFVRTPSPVPGADVIPFVKLERAHFMNAVDRSMRANRLCIKNRKRAQANAADLWAKHVARKQGYLYAREVEQQAVDYCALLGKYQRDDVPGPWAAA